MQRWNILFGALLSCSHTVLCCSVPIKFPLNFRWKMRNLLPDFSLYVYKTFPLTFISCLCEQGRRAGRRFKKKGFSPQLMFYLWDVENVLFFLKMLPTSQPDSKLICPPRIFPPCCVFNIHTLHTTWVRALDAQFLDLLYQVRRSREEVNKWDRTWMLSKTNWLTV